MTPEEVMLFIEAEKKAKQMMLDALADELLEENNIGESVAERIRDWKPRGE